LVYCAANLTSSVIQSVCDKKGEKKTMNENNIDNQSLSEDTKCRCGWVDLSKPDYVAYHDKEWGVPVRDDQKQFECLTLESAQAGLRAAL
jgi:hypothetical protein